LTTLALHAAADVAPQHLRLIAAAFKATVGKLAIAVIGTAHWLCTKAGSGAEHPRRGFRRPPAATQFPLRLQHLGEPVASRGGHVPSLFVPCAI